MNIRRALPVLVAASVGALASCLTVGSTLSPEEIAREVGGGIQAGATVEDVQAYILSDPQDLGLEDPDPTIGHARDHSRLTSEFGLDPTQTIYMAIIRDRGDQFDVVFVLDEDLLYQRLIVFEEHKAGL